mmetsp:Transcript_14317/g.28538  ORF Transcript_14317/g.28538 Transcript_14317/m.28538 type:complete len:357 (+) Transcript_14317:135-1205(+)
MKVFGVNYGNRFIPEEWMGVVKERLFKNCTAGAAEPNKSTERLCLADLGAKFEDRYLQWLEDEIQESDFVKMADAGVNVVRVPCGYWNWISFPGGSDRERVLQTIAPARYTKYFDRIFASADAHGIKVLLDLHGLPGSQNGEMHSGICKSRPEFDTEENLQRGVEAVAAMAQYCATKMPALYGLQIINEPNKYAGSIEPFLERFYDKAILAARQYLPKAVPVVVFAWTKDFSFWENKVNDPQYGEVVWDTHIYQLGNDAQHRSVKEQQHAYWGDLESLKRFHKKKPGGCIVGEWSLAGPSWGAAENKEMVAWLVWCMMERCHGCVFWNWDAPIAEWSFQGAAKEFGIDWAAIPKPS